MPVLRNPFRRSQLHTPDSFTEDERTEQSIHTNESPYLNVAPVEFKTIKGISAISITKTKEEEPGTYKLCVVNDSGVYLPPSPTEKKSFWRRNDHKSNHSSDRTSLDEPFTITRESFESYRRSFDISARSPVVQPNRGSIDSPPVSSRNSTESRLSRILEPPEKNQEIKVSEDEFEEIKLNDNSGAPKKRGLFSRFGGDSTSGSETQTTGLGSTFKFSLRKEPGVVSAQESELTRIPPRANQEEIVVG